MENIIFYIFSTIALVSAIIVISARNPVHSVLYLVLVFCSATGLLLLLEVEFIAIIFIIVYIGAIAVLFLFVVIILNIKENTPLFGIKNTGEFFKFLPIGTLIGIIFFAETFLVINYDLVGMETQISNISPDYPGVLYQNNVVSWISLLDGIGSSTSNVEILGQMLYTYYFYFFLVAGIILLVAIIGAIALTLQSKPTTKSIVVKNLFVIVKRQQIFQQLSRDSNKGVFLLRNLVKKKNKKKNNETNFV